NIFLIQIRAMLRASEKTNNLRILLPMVTDINEVKESIKLIKRARKELLEDGFHIKSPEIGIMIEVPSIIFQISHILEFVNFVSVGTNDLAQYILAIDRNNQKVAHLYSQLHPSMIHALHQISLESKKSSIYASVCGELAGNPLAAPILIGMGFNSLSMNPVNILKIKWIMRSLTFDKCKSALNHTLKLHTTEEIETYLTNFLIENNLANMIRAGN
ncbi:phosphoenolpyruvate-protein phosphotransferase PtsP, partial [Francisellaceae bacterium]|nr:phosphoenolpyruvate-protein phosphotransferase PtsP [Francisellaceae bacterium]